MNIVEQQIREMIYVGHTKLGTQKRREEIKFIMKNVPDQVLGQSFEGRTGRLSTERNDHTVKW